jgi:hypothetical protein
VAAASIGAVAYFATRSHPPSSPSPSTAPTLSLPGGSGARKSGASTTIIASSSSSFKSSSTVFSLTATAPANYTSFDLGLGDATTAFALNYNSTYVVPINRSASFTPTDPVVWTWLNFTNVNANYNLTFYWNMPNGTTFYSSSALMPSGRAFILAYDNLYIAGTAVANLAGIWNVQTYLNGTEFLNQPFFLGSYVPPLTILDSALSAQLNSTGEPINESMIYSAIDSQVLSWLQLSDLGSASHSVTWEFVAPQSVTYAEINQTITGSSNLSSISSSMLISNNPPAGDLGIWYVYFYIDNNYSSPALIQPFIIS